MRLLLGISLGVLLAAAAHADETPEGVPAGYEQIDTAGRVRLFARTRDAVPFAVKDPLLKELKALDKAWRTAFLLDRQIGRVGTQEGGIFEGIVRKNVTVILFDQDTDYEAWAKAARPPPDPAPRGAYREVVAARLKEGALSAEAYRGLRRDLANAYLQHLLLLGEPAWLIEGLARQHECSTGPKGELDPEAVEALIQTLQVSARNRSLTPGDQLLLLKGSQFKEQHVAESWALVRLLTIHAPTVIPALLESLVGLEANAWADPDRVGADLRRYAQHLLEEAFGGAERLRLAKEGFVEALLRGPDAPYKPTGVPRLAPRAAELDVEMKPDLRKRRAEGVPGIKIGNFAHGKVRSQAPWPVEVRMLCRYRDLRQTWGAEHDMNTAVKLEPGQEAKYDDKRTLPSPDFVGANCLMLIAEWRIADGGLYRTVRSLPVN